MTLLVAATTDVHGHLVGWDYYANRADTARGLARAATIVDSLRAAAPGRVVLVDAGDMLQGTPLTYVAARRERFAVHPVFAAMNAMHYDAAAVGNHEFNYGLPFLYASAKGARFPLLAANAYPAAGAPPFPGRTIIERAGRPHRAHRRDDARLERLGPRQSLREADASAPSCPPFARRSTRLAASTRTSSWS